MSSDSFDFLERVASLETRASSVGKSLSRLTAFRDRLDGDVEKTKNIIFDLDEKVEKLTKVGELFRTLMDRMIMEQLETIKSIVSEGLRSIFFDLDLSFDANVEVRRGYVNVDLVLRDGDPSRGGYEGPPLEGFGGGPVSVASLILRILMLRRLKKAPVMLLDETLSMVSEDYIENTGLFLKRLAESMGVDILLVTHNPTFLDQADMALKAEQSSEKKLVIKTIRGKT